MTDWLDLAEKLNLSNFDTHNVIGMVMMFYNCGILTTLDLSNFDMSKVTDTDNDGIFYGCKDELIVIVKDKTTQDWIFALSSKPDEARR